MAEIINLRRARKAKLRTAAADAAVQNRVLHGESKAARDKRHADKERAARLLDGVKRADEPSE